MWPNADGGRKGQGWSVPSQSGAGSYMVTGLPTEVTVEAPRCSCPDHETRLVKCKHIWAVEYVIQRETNPDGSTTITETVRVTKTERRTYAQDWPAYNRAQTTEGDLFPAMLRDLCRGIAEPEQQRRGRPRATLADSVFCAALKVYSTLSTRRFMSDLRAAQDRGLIAKAPHHSSIFRYLVRNATVIASVGAEPLIALRRNITGADIHATSAWSKMHGYFVYRRDEFLAHYHKRSNVEATFSMIKRKFGDFVRSKMHELGIAPAFQPETAA